jgi:hypothetical protein
MADKPKSGGMTHDGYKPRPLSEGYQPRPGNRGYQPQPGKVQGGYQAPGTGKPTAPTTGSGVKPPAPSPKK